MDSTSTRHCSNLKIRFEKLSINFLIRNLHIQQPYFYAYHVWMREHERDMKKFLEDEGERVGEQPNFKKFQISNYERVLQDTHK